MQFRHKEGNHKSQKFYEKELQELVLLNSKTYKQDEEINYLTSQINRFLLLSESGFTNDESENLNKKLEDQKKNIKTIQSINHSYESKINSLKKNINKLKNNLEDMSYGSTLKGFIKKDRHFKIIKEIKDVRNLKTK